MNLLRVPGESEPAAVEVLAGDEQQRGGILFCGLVLLAATQVGAAAVVAVAVATLPVVGLAAAQDATVVQVFHFALVAMPLLLLVGESRDRRCCVVGPKAVVATVLLVEENFGTAPEGMPGVPVPGELVAAEEKHPPRRNLSTGTQAWVASQGSRSCWAWSGSKRRPVPLLPALLLPVWRRSPLVVVESEYL